MNKKAYIVPESQTVALEPLQMLANSLKIDINKNTEDGVSSSDQILSNKFEWKDRENYWEDK